MDYKINIGNEIPRFKAHDPEGNEYTEEDIIGGPLVIYFYPKDETPGCSKEACSFRDQMEKLDQMGCLLIGISPDGPESHKRFIEKYNLNFSLFCDENLELCRKFDVVREKEVEGKKSVSIERTTFVVDPLGMITWIERPVTVDKHAERVTKAVEELVGYTSI